MADDLHPDPLLPDLIERAIAAHDALADLAEAVEDEWTYVNDLRAAWAERLAAVAMVRAHDRADHAMADAVAVACEEVSLITDPHRAIDWLSTLPQVVLLALGEDA